jgi:PAS domain S-box-containing protein
MAVVVPETLTASGGALLLESLAEALASSREFLGAAAGWIGLREPGRGFTFPIRQGEVPTNWLELQQARGSVWGFTVGEEPTLLNDLSPWAVSTDASLRNLLACSLRRAGEVVGYVALANKTHGFTSPDAAVLQGMAHHLGRLLDRQLASGSAAIVLTASWRRILDRATEGVLILDDSGTLVYANAVWLDWTGFAADELLGRTAPFPFWISPHDLARVTTRAPSAASTLPFRRRDQSVFWCQIETVMESWDGHSLTIAFLHQPPVLTPPARIPEDVPPPIRGDMPLALAVTDSSGRLLWSNAALARLAPRGIAYDCPLTDALEPPAAAVLDHFLHEPGGAEPGRMGALFLPTGDRPLALFWLSVPLQDGVGFLFALTDEPDGFPVLAGNNTDAPPLFSAPLPEWLPLLLEAGGGVEGWSSGWEERTGLAARDVEGSRSELVLDWLFPQQHDRDRVADCFHQPQPTSCQFILDVTTLGGSQPMTCTFLPLPLAESTAARRRWLLLVGEPDHFAGPGTPSWGFVRQFTLGLRQLLQHHLRPLDGSACLALARTDLPPEVAAWFVAVVAAGRGIESLLEDLDYLSRATPGDRLIVSFADLVRDFLDSRPAPNYELIVELPEEATPVRVNPALIQVVLHQLLTNAEQALLNGQRRIVVRVFGTPDAVRCEIEDNGEGLPIDDWTSTLAPFFSTRGAFARDPHHAALEATGLGLTVARHLLALHQGQLELRSAAAEGTTVLFTLPRADPAPVGMTLDGPVLLDISGDPRGPRLRIERTPPK